MIKQIYTSQNINTLYNYLRDMEDSLDVTYIHCIYLAADNKPPKGFYDFCKGYKDLINSYGNSGYFEIIFRIINSTENNIILYLPETELHIDLQRGLLQDIEDKCPNKDIYVGTLSPAICSKYVDLLVDLE